jgi:hypothetical protein
MMCVLLLFCCCVSLQEWDVQQLCYEVDVEPYAKSRDAAVGVMAAEAGVAVSSCVSHTLYVSDRLHHDFCCACS